jgi:hypothetical protein
MLHLYALDHLSCPAMATQYERIFRREKVPDTGEECPRIEHPRGLWMSTVVVEGWGSHGDSNSVEALSAILVV